MADCRISVRLDPKTRKRLREEVRLNGRTEADVVRAALTEYFQRKIRPESCYDLARRHGLIRGVRGLPPDLSTSKAYMEGFGE